MAHYLLYARVSPKGSTWSGTETTVHDQLADGRRHILTTDPAATFSEAVDEFATADHANMPAFSRHLADMRAGVATWDAIVFRHIDRVGRSAIEVIQLGAELQRHGKYFLAYAMPFPTAPPVGPLILGIFALLAEFERSMISQRTAAKMHAIAQHGGIPYGRAPYGYRRVPGSNVIEPDPETAPRVIDLYRRAADGEPPTALARAFGMARQTVIHILHRRTYLGLIDYGGREYHGQHQALIDQALWDRVRRHLPTAPCESHGRVPTARPGARHNSRRRPFPLSGIVRCHCGHWLTAASAHGRSRVYRYYQCTDTVNCRRRVSADDLERDVFAALEALPISDAVIEEAIRIFTEQVTASLGGPDASDEIERLRRERSTVQAEHDQVVQLFLSGVVVSANAGPFNQRLRSALDRLTAIDQRIQLLRSLTGDDAQRLADTAAWARTFHDLAKAVTSIHDEDPDAAAILLRSVIERIQLLPESGDSPHWRVHLRLPGSPILTEWLASWAADEPAPVVCLCCVGSVEVVVDLVA